MLVPFEFIIRTLPDGTAALGAAEVNLTPARTQCAAVATAPYIVFDGELFNERAEEQTDIELFEEYYLEYGKSCFSYLDGSYCCAILDGDEAIVLLSATLLRPGYAFASWKASSTLMASKPSTQ